MLDDELNATFYAPAGIEAVARHIRALGDVAIAIDAPSGVRLDLLAPGRPRPDRLRDGAYERMRVCDAELLSRGLAIYGVPADRAHGPSWMQAGWALFDALADLQPVETYPYAAFCVLLDGRPAKKATPLGIAQRVGALTARGVHVEPLTLDELDAAVAAYTAYALRRGEASFVGDPAEGRIVLPGPLREGRYPPLARPVRPAPNYTEDT